MCFSSWPLTNMPLGIKVELTILVNTVNTMNQFCKLFSGECMLKGLLDFPT